MIHIGTHPRRFEIIKVLSKSVRPVAFSEITELLGKKRNDGQIWKHLKTLEKYRIVRNVRQIKINPRTGKPCTSLFVLTEIGTRLFERIMEALKSRGISSPFFALEIFHFVFFRKS